MVAIHVTIYLRKFRLVQVYRNVCWKIFAPVCRLVQVSRLEQISIRNLCKSAFAQVYLNVCGSTQSFLL